jgi:hypothetical protein
MQRTYEIDGARFSTLEEFYDEISRVLIPGTVQLSRRPSMKLSRGAGALFSTGSSRSSKITALAAARLTTG